MSCEQIRARIHLYLDGELPPTAALALESHLVDCPGCRREYESLVSVVETVRAATPLYKAPEESLQRASRMVSARRKRLALYRAAAAAVILVCGFLAFWAVRGTLSGPRDGFATFAAGSHLRYSRGALPLDIHSDEPQVVAMWLSSRLPFRMSLPNYPAEAGHAKRYSLVGARLVQYRDDDVAYLSYRMDGRPISLLIGSSARIVPAGGDVYRAGGLSFHTTSHNGLKMITWIDKGLSYALVSDLAAVGAESCVICHGGADERHKFEPLRAKP